MDKLNYHLLDTVRMFQISIFLGIQLTALGIMNYIITYLSHT